MQQSGVWEKTTRAKQQGKTAITSVVLRPNAIYSGERIPDQSKIEKMHHRAHELCFIANSIKSEVTTEIVS